METVNKRRDWTPVRKGHIFCSPACGRKCTHHEYLMATQKAENLVKKCELEIGGEWETRVHENLGWHWSVFHKESKISISYGGYLSQGSQYHVSLCGGTPTQISVNEGFETPKDAWDAQIKRIEKEAERWNEVLKSAKKK